MAKSVEYEIKVKDGGSNVIRSVTMAANETEEALGRVAKKASEAGKKLLEMAEFGVVFDTAARAFQNFSNVVSELATPFNSFEQSMRAANTMAGKSGEEFDAMKEKIVGLSKEIPIAREELANGLYQVISNGVPENNWLDFLEQSAKASVGGLADLSEVVKVTSTMIKNYQLDWSNAEAVQDMIQMTAKNGVTSFGELADALPRVSGRAASLGVSMDELMAVFAATTGSLGNSAEVATKLGAVLTSLTKPSSEATTAAAAMGISFDAASIKACGGLQNFLTELDASVQAYSAKTGQLSDTIYGQLFGSAEALSLLNSLNGAQREKFAENVDAMAQSAGSISGSYMEMSNTGEATAQINKNMTQAFMDAAGAAASAIAPYSDLIASYGILVISSSEIVTGTIKTIQMIKTLKLSTIALTIAQKTAAIAATVWTGVQKALNLVLTANPIGIVIAAIAALVAGIAVAYNKSETFRSICDQVWAVMKKVARVIIDQLVEAFKKTVTVIKEAWGYIEKLFGITDDAEETAEATEGQAEATEKVANASKEAADAVDRLANANKKVATNGLAAKSANDWKKMSYENLGKAIETQKAQVQQLSETESAESKKKIADLKAMESRYKKLGSLLGLTDSNMFDGKSLIQNATSMKALANNVQYYQTQLEKADSTDRKTIQTLTEKIRVTQEAQKAVQTLVASYSRPADLSTLNRLDEEIQYQQSLLGQASESERQAIQQTIEQLERQQKVEKLNLHTAQEIGDIHTWTDLNDELTYYNDKLNLATEEERADILRIIEALNRLKQSWDDAAAELKKPGEVGTLNTIRDLNAAVNWYEQAMQRASGSELTELGKQKEAYQQKLDALKRVTMVLEQQRSLETLNGLSGKTLDMELKLVGLDQIKSNIRSLQKMLDDTKNPLDDSTRSTVQENIATWKKYERQLKKGQASYKEVWSSTKNVGSGVQSITQALKSDGKAWDKVTGVVDGALSVFDGIKDIVKMVQLLTGATQDQTSAQTEHAVATSIDAAVQGEQATATGEAALAEGVNEGALSAETNTAYEDASAHMLLAASKTMEAHAEIPFVGIAIAGGLIAAMTAILFALPKFADGGIAYGPTLGVFGEYAGAASNPEVVAPLSKLRELIGSEPDSIGGKVEFRLKGRRLVGVLERERRIQARR